MTLPDNHQLLQDELTLQRQSNQIVDLAIAGFHPDEIAESLGIDIQLVMVTLEAGAKSTNERFKKLEFLRALNLVRLERALKAIQPLAIEGVPRVVPETGEVRAVMDDRYYDLYLKTIKLQMDILDKMEARDNKRKDEEREGFKSTINVEGDLLVVIRDRWMKEYENLGAADLITKALEPGSHPLVAPRVNQIERRAERLIAEAEHD